MSKERALEILQGTRKLLEDPTRWCAGRWAKDGQGNGCNPRDPHAACWCLEGAMRKVAWESGVQKPGYIEAVVALKEPCLTKKNDDLYNDNDHPALMAWIDRGISRLSGKRLQLP